MTHLAEVAMDLNRNSERIPRSLLRGWRANPKQTESPREVEDSLQLGAGSFNQNPASLHGEWGFSFSSEQTSAIVMFSG